MRKMLAAIGTALMLLAPLHAIAQDDLDSGIPTGADEDDSTRIKPSGPRPPQPIERKKYDEAVAKLFKQGDTNGDGIITLAELNAVIDARKTTAVGARFAAIDTNHDKSISFDEFVQWQRSLGSAVLSDAATGDGLAIVPEDIRLEPGRSDIDQLLARLIEPLNATMLVAANTDYDTGVSLAELTAYEGKRFAAADTNHDGWLTQDEAGIYLGQVPSQRGGAGGFGGGERGGGGRGGFGHGGGAGGGGRGRPPG